MSLRRVKQELEAKLTGGTSGLFSKPSGKLERKSYANSAERLKVSLRDLEAPDGSTAIVTADGQEIARVPIQNGAGRLDHESRPPGGLPKLKPDQLIEVSVNGSLVLSGKLYLD